MNNPNQPGNVKDLCELLDELLQTKTYCLEYDDPRRGEFGHVITWYDDKGFEKTFIVSRELYKIKRTREVDRIAFKRLKRKLTNKNKFFFDANDVQTRQQGLVIPGVKGSTIYVNTHKPRFSAADKIGQLKSRIKNGSKLSFNFNKDIENECK